MATIARLALLLLLVTGCGGHEDDQASERSPTRSDYIGNAARDGRMAVVFAQLVVGDRPHGVHAFMVPVRDESGGQGHHLRRRPDRGSPVRRLRRHTAGAVTDEATGSSARSPAGRWP